MGRSVREGRGGRGGTCRGSAPQHLRAMLLQRRPSIRGSDVPYLLQVVLAGFCRFFCVLEKLLFYYPGESSQNCGEHQRALVLLFCFAMLNRFLGRRIGSEESHSPSFRCPLHGSQGVSHSCSLTPSFCPVKHSSDHHTTQRTPHRPLANIPTNERHTVP